MGGIPYSGSGTINGALYTFDPILSENISLQDFNPSYPAVTIQVILEGFTLNSETTLSGHFNLSYEPFAVEIPFEGQKATVPVPCAVYLLASGIICLVGFRRKFKAAS